MKLTIVLLPGITPDTTELNIPRLELNQTGWYWIDLTGPTLYNWSGPTTLFACCLFWTPVWRRADVTA